MTNDLGSNTVVQVGIIVPDIERKLDSYCAGFGLRERPMVIITDPVEQAHTTYHGESTPARAKLAFINLGQISIELIEPIGGPSTWQEFPGQHGEGAHHIAFHIKDTPQVVSLLNNLGISTPQQGDYTGGRYTYGQHSTDGCDPRTVGKLRVKFHSEDLSPACIPVRLVDEKRRKRCRRKR